MTTPTLKHFTPNSTIKIPACGSWNACNYLLEKESAYALEMALKTQRPLLVKGDPGLGKSYLARAAAAHLDRQFITEIININTEGQDLLWRYDLVSRLADAHTGKKGVELDPKHYINPGVLWWAFNWADAQEHYNKTCLHKIYCPKQDNGDYKKGVVLLIDEIDKADPSLPNSLLEVLGNGGFHLPLLEKTIQTEEQQPAPLVIITTNDERELPPAFVRRCLVLNLEIDKDIETWLLKRANIHFSEQQCNENIKREAAIQLIKDREDAEKQGLIKAGLAEYLDLLQALDEMTDNTLQGQQREAYQKALLKEIQDFVLKKVG